MAGNKKINSDLEVLGKSLIHTVPNSTGTVMTYNTTSKELSTRTNAEIISDLGLITATNIAASYYTKTQLQTSGQAQVNWGNLTGVPSTFPATAHNHDDRYYTETESDAKYVPYTGATSNVNLATKNLEFTTGSISRTQGNSRIFKNVYQASVQESITGIISIKFPQPANLATMFDVSINFYSYSSKYLGSLRISFYRMSNTSINANGARALITGTSNFPLNTVQVGIDGNSNICINLGSITTNWNSYLSFEVERVETKYYGHTVDWSLNWTHTIETVAPALVANQGTYISILDNAAFSTEVIDTHTHANKAFLDTVNQNLGTTHSPTFSQVVSTTGAFRTDAGAVVFGSTIGAVKPIHTGGVLASNSYTDSTKIPTQGIYSKGNILVGGNFIKEGGTSSQFLKADGSVDTNSYALNNHNHDNQYVIRSNTANVDPNTVLYSSALRFDAHANTPTSTYYAIMTYGNNSNVVSQLATKFGSSDTYIRSYTSGGWSSWNRLWSTENFTPTNYYTKTESLGLFVGLTGVQTIQDTKTFSSSPIVPAATLASQAVNLGQVQTIVDTAVTASESSDKFKTTITQSGEVEHMLNTYDVTVEFYDTATMFTVGARVQRLTTNKVKVEFDTTPTNPIKVLIRKF